MGIAAAREKLLRDQMLFDRKYSFAQLYQIYLDIMRQDYFIANGVVVSEKTIRNQLSAIANSDSWLCFEDGLYYKREPRCYFVRLHEWLIKLNEGIREWVKSLILTLKYRRKG